MKLSDYLDSIKLEKNKNGLMDLTLSVLKTEETLVEKEVKNLEAIKNLLYHAFYFIKENKIEINSDVQDLDLDFWKNNIHIYKIKTPTVNSDVFLYSIRNSLRYLLEYKKEKNKTKAYIFEVVIKTFLFIDFLGLSIDSLIAS